MSFDRLRYFIAQRAAIQRKRESGAPWPSWYGDDCDPILREGKFCHIQREDDHTARTVARCWRDAHTDDPDLLVAMAIAVRINHAETIEEIGWPLPWPGEVATKLMARFERGEPCTNQRAYKVLGGKPRGMDVVPAFVHVLFPQLWTARDFLRPREGETCRAVYERLTTLHGWGKAENGKFSGFIAAQAVTATRFAGPLRNATDFMSFVVSGPGSRPGLHLALGRPVETAKTAWRDEAHWYAEFLPVFEEVIKPEAAKFGFDLRASDGQNVLCEYRKWEGWTQAGKPGIPYIPRDRRKGTTRRPKPRRARPVGDAAALTLTPAAPTRAPAPLPVTYRPAAGEPVLFFDVETRSIVDLPRAGAWRYAADSSTEVIIIAYAIDAKPVQIWHPGEPIPEVFSRRDTRLVCHNAQFELAILRHVLMPRHGWPAIPIERFRCTMAMALAAALPGALENAAAALELPIQKDQAGAQLMRQMAKRYTPTS